MGMGLVLTALRRGAVLASGALQRRMLISLEVPNRDRAYAWVLQWMALQQERQQALALTSPSHSISVMASAGAASASSNDPSPMKVGSLTRLMSRLAPKSERLSLETRVQTHRNGSASIGFALVAGPGTHWLRYRGCWIQAKRERDVKSLSISAPTPTGGGGGGVWETLTLTTLRRDAGVFNALLAEARDAAMREQEGKLVLYTAWGTEWRPFGVPRRKRTLGSVVLAEGVAERVVRDVKAFLGRRKWYADRGMFLPFSRFSNPFRKVIFPNVRVF